MSKKNVAPRAGAWIETFVYTEYCSGAASLPARERGSKRIKTRGRIPAAKVAPRAGAWIETQPPRPISRRFKSLPARERGSKPLRASPELLAGAGRSPRGSVDRNSTRGQDGPVAKCRSPRGSVDRNPQRAGLFYGRRSRSPRGSVDRNRLRPIAALACLVAPRAGAWIETVWKLPQMVEHRRRSPRGSVDRNSAVTNMNGVASVSLPARERGSKPQKPVPAPMMPGSLPARERGSNTQDGRFRSAGALSLPARERGSKLRKEREVFL